MYKSNTIIAGAAALVALIAISGFAYGSFAQNTTTADNNNANTQFRGRMHNWENLTDEQKQEMEEKRAARQAEMDAKRTEMNNAIQQGYSAWVEAVKKNMGESALILSRVNESNFAKFAEAHNYMERGRALMEEIGVKQGFGGRGMMGKGGFRGVCGQEPAN